ncbi:MAG: hypothetical protein WBM04_05995 [Candidatus Korobacteraceae bacterium]
MTIAIGILASDGIVIAADREESDDYLKTDQGKITWKFRGIQPVGACAVMGAGDGAYLDEIGAELIDIFADDGDGSENVLMSKLRNAHRSHYKRTVIPLSGERPHYSLLIGCYGANVKCIWKTSRMAFTKVQDYDAVGIGSKVASSWLNKLYDRIPTLYAAKLATYVIYQVKRTVGGCGLGTDVLVIKNTFPSYVSDGVVRHWEEIFRSYTALERNCFYYCIGLETKQKFLARTQLGKDPLVGALDEFRNALTQLDLQKSEDQQ